MSYINWSLYLVTNITNVQKSLYLLNNHNNIEYFAVLYKRTKFLLILLVITVWTMLWKERPIYIYLCDSNLYNNLGFDPCFLTLNPTAYKYYTLPTVFGPYAGHNPLPHPPDDFHQIPTTSTSEDHMWAHSGSLLGGGTTFFTVTYERKIS
jgi:hypothetical protein